MHYRIWQAKNNTKMIDVPLNERQLRLLHSILYKEINNLRDNFPGEDRKENLKQQSLARRVYLKITKAIMNITLESDYGQTAESMGCIPEEDYTLL